MPNHTSCILRVVGTLAALRAFKDKAYVVTKEDDDTEVRQCFSLDPFVPMPEDLRGTSSPAHIVSEEEYDKIIADNAKKLAGDPKLALFLSKPITLKIQAELLRKYGVDNWYDWANNHWGTKWGVYRVSETWEESPAKENLLGFGERAALIPAGNYQITCHFKSAWAPPSAALRTISEQYPDLKFFCGYADEGGCFLGYSIFEKGVEQEVELPKKPWNGEQQKEFRRLCGQTIYEDEESDEDEDEVLTE